jgi:ATP-independent RNA helicase DbpA
VVSELQAQGFSALALFGELEQRERDEVLVQFANKSCSVLVATDVAARGLDIADLSAVINVDVTPDPEVHIHRIGRTGRGDAEGLALNLVSMDEMGSVGKIEQLQGRASQFFPVDELTPAAGGELLPPMMTIQIIGGRKEKIRAGDVMGAMCADFGYSREQIGKISVNDFSTYVAVDRKIASAACAKLNAARSRARRSRRGCSKTAIRLISSAFHKARMLTKSLLGREGFLLWGRFSLWRRTARHHQPRGHNAPAQDMGAILRATRAPR